MFNNILVPIDMSHLAEGRSIVDIAVREAAGSGKIKLLNVVDEIPNWAAINLPADLSQKTIATARETLESIARDSGASPEIEVRSGRPSDAILACAKEFKADLIIVASHQPGLQDYLIGSTASRIVRHATCSVLVVR